jgi:hypothetical protein
MRFPINASTFVRFGGDRYLHAFLGHSFAGEDGQKLQLVARARQFSSFILLVGRISSATLFDPKGAIIIQNKDDLKIPLILETIPTPKEFKDAIESLSPEQQAFAKAYRAMQLESSMFGLVVIQIKPQLEKLLKLPSDSLTKEIRLTQDLMELFMKYQIPSDMVTFGGPDDAPDAPRLAEVKRHVKAMQDMINSARRDQLIEAKQESVVQKLDKKKKYKHKEVEKERKEEKSMVRKKMASKDSAPRMRSASPAMPSKPMASASVPMPSPAPMPASAPATSAVPAPTTTTTTTTTTPAKPDEPKVASNEVSESSETDLEVLEYTKIPAELDGQFEELDEDAAVRPTIINPGLIWTKTSQASLMSSPTTTSLNPEQTKSEQNRAFDLLDALTRSGALLVDHAELHVVLAATHCFDKSLLETVVKDNVNPIEKVERSSLIMNSTIHGLSPQELIKPEQHGRVKLASPALFAIADK